MKSISLSITREIAMSVDPAADFGALWPLPLGSQVVNGGPTATSLPPGYAWPTALTVLNTYPPAPPPAFAKSFSAITLNRLAPDGLSFIPQPMKVTQLAVYLGLGTGYVYGGNFYSNGSYYSRTPDIGLIPTPLCFGPMGDVDAVEFYPVSTPGNEVSGAFPHVRSCFLKEPILLKGFDAAVAKVGQAQGIEVLPLNDYYFGSCAIQIIASIEVDPQFLSNEQTAQSDLVIIIPFGTGGAILGNNYEAASLNATPESSIGCFFIPLQAVRNSLTGSITLTQSIPQSYVAGRNYVHRYDGQYYLIGQRHSVLASFRSIPPSLPLPPLSLCDLGAGGGPLL